MNPEMWSHRYVSHLVGAFLCPLLNVSHPQFLRVCKMLAHSLDYIFLDLTSTKTRWEILFFFGIFTVVCFIGVSNYHVIVVFKTQLDESRNDMTLQERSQLITNHRRSSKRYTKPRTTIEIHHERVITSFLTIWELAAWIVMMWIMGSKFVICMVYVKAVHYRNFGIACICLGLAAAICSMDTSHEESLAKSILEGVLEHGRPNRRSFNSLIELVSWLTSTNKASTETLF